MKVSDVGDGRKQDPEWTQTIGAQEEIEAVIEDLEAAAYILDLSAQANQVEENGNRQMNRLILEVLLRDISRLKQVLREL